MGFQSSSLSTKYLSYAIGEIVLVVFGILIALQINNWNQDRLNAIEEQQILHAISQKMNFNHFQHNLGTKNYEEVISSAHRLLNNLNESDAMMDEDELDLDLYKITKRFVMGASNATNIYDELIASDQMSLLRSVQMRDALTSLKVQLQLLASYEILQNYFVDNQLNPFMNRYLDRLDIYRNESVSGSSWYYDSSRIEPWKVESSKFESDYKALNQSREFSNLLLELIIHTEKLLPIYYRIGNQISVIDSISNANFVKK